MHKKLRHQSAFITGGSNGIGKAITTAFASEGANVVFTYNQSSELEIKNFLIELRSHGIKADALQVDLSSDHAFKKATEKVEDFSGNFDILVNNVGILTRTEFLDITEEEWDKIMSVNLKLPFLFSQYFAKNLIIKKQPGSIINISSLSAHLSRSRVAHYQSSKAGLNMLSRSMAYELAPFKIRVNTITPGLTQTNANQDQWKETTATWKERTENIPLGRAGLPDDYKSLAVLLASNDSSWITGSEFIVDGGMSIV